MWGRNAIVRRVFAVALLVASCGGRSIGHLPGVEEESGGAGGVGASGGVGGSVTGSSGSLAITGGTAGTSAGTAGAAGAGGLLRPCGSGIVGPELFPPLVLMLDASDALTGSSPQGVSYWKAATSMTLALLATLRDGARFGLTVVEGATERDVCSLPSPFVPPLPLDAQRREAISNLLEISAGGDPVLEAGYRGVLDGLESPEDDPEPASVVFVGNGYPQLPQYCPDGENPPLETRLEMASEAARTRGIDTFAIGFDDDPRGRNLLASIAIAGGTAPVTCLRGVPGGCYYDLSASADLVLALSDAFHEIALRSPSSCQFELDDLPSERVLDPEHVTFMLKWNRLGSLLERVERVERGRTCSMGWWLSDDGQRVVLCPDVCESLRSDAATELEINVACDGPPPRN